MDKTTRVDNMIFPKRHRNSNRFYMIIGAASMFFLVVYWLSFDKQMPETLGFVQHQVTFEGRLPIFAEEDPNQIYGDRIQAQLDRKIDVEPHSVVIYRQPEDNAIQKLWEVENCPAKCAFTNMDSMIHSSDALIFTPDFIDRIPLDRNTNQLWFLQLLESPLNTQTLIDFNGKINYTVSYRYDADFVSPYGRYVREKNIRSNFISWDILRSKHRINFGSKTKNVSWSVSHCLTPNHRWQYAKQLQKFIDVKIFGECGEGHIEEEELRKTLKHDYKFYLSFENSNCGDYITEKFFENALKNDVIPIVMGAPKEDYVKVAPPNSFIHVSDFEDAEQLAKYLHYLSGNETAYREYFQWREWGKIEDASLDCRICMFMQKPTPKWYPDVEQWWQGRNECMFARTEKPFQQ